MDWLVSCIRFVVVNLRKRRKNEKKAKTNDSQSILETVYINNESGNDKKRAQNGVKREKESELHMY